jgi:hypothetical protein
MVPMSEEQAKCELEEIGERSAYEAETLRLCGPLASLLPPSAADRTLVVGAKEDENVDMEATYRGGRHVRCIKAATAIFDIQQGVFVRVFVLFNELPVADAKLVIVECFQECVPHIITVQ